MQKVTFGKNAIIRIAKITAGLIAADGTVTKPSPEQFRNFCLPKEISFGGKHGKIDIESFCTGGRTVSMKDGSYQGTLDLGEVYWTEDDPAIILLEGAAQDTINETGGYVWFEVLPTGVGAGKIAYDFLVDVDEWNNKIPSKGLITATYNLAVLEGPTRSKQGQAVVMPAPVALVSGTAVPNIAAAEGASLPYTITLANPGTLDVVLTGGTGNADLRVLDKGNNEIGASNHATNEEHVALPNLAAGTYEIQVVAATDFDGASLTATVTP